MHGLRSQMHPLPSCTSLTARTQFHQRYSTLFRSLSALCMDLLAMRLTRYLLNISLIQPSFFLDIFQQLNIRYNSLNWEIYSFYRLDLKASSTRQRTLPFSHPAVTLFSSILCGQHVKVGMYGASALFLFPSYQALICGHGRKKDLAGYPCG